MARLRAVLTCALVLVLPWPAHAQPTGRLGVSGGVEYARVTEDDGFLGAGLGGSLGLTVALTNSTNVEVEVGWVRHVRDFDAYAVAFGPQGRVEAFPWQLRRSGTATFVVGLLSRAFGASGVRPVVWAGGGVMHHGGTLVRPVTRPDIPQGFTLQPEDAAALAGEPRGGDVNALVFDGGAGADIRVRTRVSVRPFAGVRLTTVGNFGPKYLVRAGVRAAYRW